MFFFFCRTYIEKLQILMTLESLGYSLSVEELDNCNKTNLIYKILRMNSSNSVIVQSLAKLSARYDIWDSNIWDMILQSFINLSLVSIDHFLLKFEYCPFAQRDEPKPENAKFINLPENFAIYLDF